MLQLRTGWRPPIPAGEPIWLVPDHERLVSPRFPAPSSLPPRVCGCSVEQHLFQSAISSGKYEDADDLIPYVRLALRTALSGRIGPHLQIIYSTVEEVVNSVVSCH